ncbi:MAG: antitoxin protein ParD-4 [Rhizobium sp.]|nr:antitoxin protein ParD-4 [Rhizobium sp.]
MTKVLSLSDPLGEWAEEQAANNNFESASEYVESVLLKEQRKQEGLAEFDRLIQAGIDSGISDRTIEEILADARQQVKDRQNAKL